VFHSLKIANPEKWRGHCSFFELFRGMTSRQSEIAVFDDVVRS